MTATIIENDLDTDDMTVLDFEPQFPCEAYEDCPNEPDYKVLTKCCGSMVLVCEECLFAYLEYQKAMSAEGMSSKCMQCNHKFPNPEFPVIIQNLRT